MTYALRVAASLQKQLSRFLREKRGEMSYPAFARKTGISSASLHRMEMGQQNVTLKTLEQILKRFKCTMSDIFTGGNVTAFLETHSQLLFLSAKEDLTIGQLLPTVR